MDDEDFPVNMNDDLGGGNDFNRSFQQPVTMRNKENGGTMYHNNLSQSQVI